MNQFDNMKFQQDGHTAPELYTGFVKGNRPSIGSVVSKLRGDGGVLGISNEVHEQKRWATSS